VWVRMKTMNEGNAGKGWSKHSSVFRWGMSEWRKKECSSLFAVSNIWRRERSSVGMALYFAFSFKLFSVFVVCPAKVERSVQWKNQRLSREWDKNEKEKVVLVRDRGWEWVEERKESVCVSVRQWYSVGRKRMREKRLGFYLD